VERIKLRIPTTLIVDLQDLDGSHVLPLCHVLRHASRPICPVTVHTALEAVLLHARITLVSTTAAHVGALAARRSATGTRSGPAAVQRPAATRDTMERILAPNG